MTSYRRITPDGNNIEWYTALERRLSNLETPPSGPVTIRDQITTTDPVTGVSTVFGRLPDGTYGLLEHVNDITPPGKPSAPSAEGTVGGIIVRWSGLDAQGDPQPTDYHHTDVEYSTTGTEWTVGARLTATASNTSLPGLSSDTDYQIRLRSFDTNNNASEYSTTAVARPVAPGGGSDVDVDALREEFNTQMGELETALASNKSLIDRKTTTFYGTVPPTKTSPAGILSGDTYRQRNTEGNIVAEWEWVVTNNVGDWVQRKITSDSIVSISTTQLVAGTASIGTGVADRLFADIFSTRKLNASQVFIGEGGNLFIDPTFADTGSWSGTSAQRSVVTGGGRNDNNALAIPATSTLTGSYYGNADRNKQFRVTPGSKYRVSVFAKADSAVPVGGVSVYGMWTNPSTSVAGSAASPARGSNTAAMAAGVWTEITYTMTVPDGATKAYVGLFTEASANVRVLFSEPSVREAITPSLIVDGLMNGQRIVGASIETDFAENVGVKLNTSGLTSHAVTRNFNPVAQTDDNYQSKASLTQRNMGWTHYPSDLWPGLFFESTPIGNTRLPVFAPAGLLASDASAQGVQLVSSQETKDNYLAYVVVNPFKVSNMVTGAKPMAGSTETTYSQSVSDVTAEGFLMQTLTKNTVTGTMTTEFSLDARKRVPATLTAPYGFTVNGAVVGGDSGWRDVSYSNGWMNYGNGFGGLQYRKVSGVLYLRGSVKGGVRDSIMTNLPNGYRPVVPTGTTAMEFPISVTQGGTWYAGSIYAYSNGNLVYNAPPGVWGGTDRVVINAAFPL